MHACLQVGQVLAEGCCRPLRARAPLPLHVGGQVLVLVAKQVACLGRHPRQPLSRLTSSALYSL